jgi:DNA polymerase III delta prime subunit
MKLAGVADQPRAVEQLRRALDTDRVAHAYAFVGPVGSGRFTTALAFAFELLEPNAAGARPGQATHGTSRADGPRYNHPDLHVVTPTPPESNPRGARAIRIGAIRELERRASLRPALAARRVLILDEADRMTGDAPQAFLKFLEEPPPATVVILVLSGVRAVPATVISRCQIVRFRPRRAGAAAAEMAAEAAAWIEESRSQGMAALFKRTERVDRERAEALIDGCWLLCRDLVLARAGAPPTLLTDPTRADAVAAEAARWPDDAALYRTIEACREARLALINNVTPRLTVDTLLARVARRAA